MKSRFSVGGKLSINVIRKLAASKHWRQPEQFSLLRAVVGLPRVGRNGFGCERSAQSGAIVGTGRRD